MKTVELEYQGQKLVLETGRVAKQAHGSVMVHYGDTVVLVTATAQKDGSDADFFPLTCVYQVKTYSQGKILGGFVKRERMPSENEILNSRIIDRPIRPLFAEGFNAETQVIATVLSYDEEASPVAAALLGASAALMISDIPFETPVAGINVGRVNGQFIANPSPAQLEESDIDLFLVAKEDAIVMVEAGAKMVSEEDMVDALEFGHEAILPLIKAQKDLVKKAGVAKRTVEIKTIDEKIVKAITKSADKGLKKALEITTKIERYAAVDQLKKELVAELVVEGGEITKDHISHVLEDLKKKTMRELILKKNRRVDGRKAHEIRPISCETGILPRAHGSALFTRGETQAIVVSTLGTKDGEQMVEDPTGLYSKEFYLHYNFPPYSVGEVKRLAAPGRREIGHGNLAERGLRPVVPAKENFPYTIRIVSEITESNGSSSMASVCGGSLSMMDAGVPISEAVAGVAMGMITEGKDYAILTDILGDEDHIGDMDFKVVGTQHGITALQMDIKIDGLSLETVAEALEAARKGRIHVLGEMAKALKGPREHVSSQAPRFIQTKVPTAKIRDIIGPGGKVIKGIQAESGAKVEIDDSGTVNISSADYSSAQKALALIRELVQEVEIGAIYEGEVKKVVDFGCFVEILPNTQGLVHISEAANEKIESMESFVSEGQMVKVKAIGRDNKGRLKLSMKAALED